MSTLNPSVVKSLEIALQVYTNLVWFAVRLRYTPYFFRCMSRFYFFHAYDVFPLLKWTKYVTLTTAGLTFFDFSTGKMSFSNLFLVFFSLAGQKTDTGSWTHEKRENRACFVQRAIHIEGLRCHPYQTFYGKNLNTIFAILEA